MFLFSNQPGIVGAMVTGGAMPFSILIGGNDGTTAFPTPAVAKAILSGYDVHKQAGFGLSHTLLERIYAHVFGERAGEATVSGFGFPGVCNSEGNYVGFDAVHTYFESVNASRNGMPVRLVFGPRTTLFGMMTDLQYSVSEPETGLGSFRFLFKTFPRAASDIPFWELLGGQANIDDSFITTEETE